jgi:hypothetical protein
MIRQNCVRQDDEVHHIEGAFRSEVPSSIEFEHVTGDCTCSGKRCPHCKQWKCREAFGINRIQKDGLQPYCCTCRALLSKKPGVELHVEFHCITDGQLRILELAPAGVEIAQGTQ